MRKVGLGDYQHAKCCKMEHCTGPHWFIWVVLKLLHLLPVPASTASCTISECVRVCACVCVKAIEMAMMGTFVLKRTSLCTIIWFNCVHSVLASSYNMCPSNYSKPVLLCVTFQELLLCEVQSLSCQAQPWVFPLPFYLSTEEALWGFGVAAVWFRSFQHQAANPSPMHSEVCLVEASTYCLHCPTQYCFTWQGQPSSLSVSQPSVSVCVCTEWD